MSIMSPVAADTSIPFEPRGPLSSLVLAYLSGDADELPAREHVLGLASRMVESAEDIATHEDVQLTLFALYGIHYGSIPGIDASREWDVDLLRLRRILEIGFEASLRAQVLVPETPAPEAGHVARALFALTAEDPGPSVSRYMAKKATLDQAREFLILRSIYTLREADPHSWAIPRLTGAAKAALVEIQADEYGGGRPERVHAQMFADSMLAAGLDDAYGTYVDQVPAITLASLNMMSMFGLHRRLLGAIVGHLAAFEMTSSIPNRLYADGLRRVGFDDTVAAYFDEHVEADAVHEQIAGRDMAGSLAESSPELLSDIMFGAAACLAIDGRVGEHMYRAWTTGSSALRDATAA